MEACEKVGRSATCAQLYKEQMIAGGFTNVVETKYIWPSNRWPKDKKLKELGLFTPQPPNLLTENKGCGSLRTWVEDLKQSPQHCGRVF
jgi:hypothetical protein